MHVLQLIPGELPYVRDLDAHELPAQLGLLVGATNLTMTPLGRDALLCTPRTTSQATATNDAATTLLRIENDQTAPIVHGRAVILGMTPDGAPCAYPPRILDELELLAARTSTQPSDWVVP